VREPDCGRCHLLRDQGELLVDDVGTRCSRSESKVKSTAFTLKCGVLECHCLRSV